MTEVMVENLCRYFGEGPDRVVALNNVSFAISGSLFVSIVGPSGCGKSTLLNVLSGVLPPSSGTVRMMSDERKSRIGYVFQDARLLPWRTALENLMLVQHDREDAEARCLRYLDMVHLQGQRDKWPRQLSGGMQQRAGIARAFSVEPDVLIMDEPFSHLDAITARSLRRELYELWQQTKKTVIFVTHDVGEAVELSQRVIILAPGGRVVQDMENDLPYPRESGDDQVALAKARILRSFEDLDLLAT